MKPKDIAPAPLQDLEQTIGYTFQDQTLLQTALTHPSRSNEVHGGQKRRKNYEQLEFLGDAVLSFTVADYLYRHYSRLDEGILSSARKEVVEKDALQAYARSIELGKYIDLGRGAQQLRNTPSVLENVFEALVGALYLDGGLEQAQPFILRFVEQDLKQAVPFLEHFGSATDCKTRLQQFIQEDYRDHAKIEYIDLDRQGPDHRPVYTVGVFLDDQEIGVGTGSSKKEAQQQAARRALELFASDFSHQKHHE